MFIYLLTLATLHKTKVVQLIHNYSYTLGTNIHIDVDASSLKTKPLAILIYIHITILAHLILAHHMARQLRQYLVIKHVFYIKNF